MAGAIDCEHLSLQRPDGPIRGRLAPHGQVITWDDGAVWRRSGSALEKPPLPTPIAGARTRISEVTTPRKALLNVLTCSPTGQHPELIVSADGLGLTIGDRTFPIPTAAPKALTPPTEIRKNPRTEAAPTADQPNPPAAR